MKSVNLEVRDKSSFWTHVVGASQDPRVSAARALAAGFQGHGASFVLEGPFAVVFLP